MAVFLLIKVPQWQAARWEGRIEAKEVAKQESDTRTTMVQAIGGAVLFIGLYFTLRNLQLTQDRQIIEHYTRAVEQLGSDKLEVRLGAIYALERIARDSERDHWPIMEILTAYVREHAPWPPKAIPLLADDLSPTEKFPEGKDQPPPKLATDIQAVLTVLGRRTRIFGKGEEQPLDLSHTDLPRANLDHAQLQRANLRDAQLQGARFMDAQLQIANLRDAQLQRAFFGRAQLEGAYLGGAQLQIANLRDAQLQGARLDGAHLEGAWLREAHLDEAWLREAHIEGAYLAQAHLTRADLKGAHLNNARLWRTNLKGAKNLTVEQLSTVETLYQAELDPPLLEQIQQRYPHLLEKPQNLKEGWVISLPGPQL